MDSKEIRRKFLEFFEKRGHKVVPSSSLIPTDPSVLLTTAGMQQFKPYYTGEKDPMADFGSQRTCSIQKSFRTSDIDEVGDEFHLTFFEMLGNFSFAASAEASGEGGDNPSNFGKDGYFKKSAIFWAHEFITKELGLKIDYVSIFDGEAEIPRDDESEKIWKEVAPDIKIKEFGKKDNFWGPTGQEGPCGPTTEIYVDGVEIWNIVFNEYYCAPAGKTLGVGGETPSVKEAGALRKLENPGVDTGMGLERLAMIVQNKKTIFETDLFEPFRTYLISGNVFQGNLGRIISDHLRASAFLLADGVRPSNKEAGYILRRLLRRVIVQNKKFGFSQDFIEKKIEEVIDKYNEFPDYHNLKIERKIILGEFRKEASKFNVTLDNGLKEFYKKYPEMEAQINAPQEKGIYKFHHLKVVSGEDAFYFHQTYGLTIDVIKDLARLGGHSVDEESFNREFKKHQEISRAGAEKKFGGHGIAKFDPPAGGRNSKLTRLHTATHLLLAALRKVLVEEVEQRGSDINEERTRFDFNFPRKLTEEEIKKIEDLVNEKIRDNLEVVCEEMTLEEAKKIGATGVFEHKYGKKVKVYSVGDPSLGSWQAFSKEICAGPHIKNIGEIGKFKITKEESVSAGIRRLRAVID